MHGVLPRSRVSMYIFNFCLFVLDIDEYTGNPCDILKCSMFKYKRFIRVYLYEGDGESRTGNRFLVYSSEWRGDYRLPISQHTISLSTFYISPSAISAGRHCGLLERLVILRNHISPGVASSRKAITLKNFD